MACNSKGDAVTRLIIACAVVIGICTFAPTRVKAGVYVRAPGVSVNVGRPYYRPYRYYRPYGYYGYRGYYRPYYRVRPYKRRCRRRWRRSYYW